MLSLEWLPNVTSQAAGRFEPITSRPNAQNSTDIPASLGEFTLWKKNS